MRARRLLFALAGAVLGVLAFSVAPAFAATGYGLLASFGAGQNAGPAPVGLAVDDSSSASAGDVYVTDGEVVNKYTAAEAAAGATTPTLAPLTKFGYAFGVAVDQSDGDVYVSDEAGTVHKFNASGTPIAFSLSGATVASPYGIAVNPSNGNVLVGDSATNTVFEFSSAGVFTGNEYIVGVASPFGVAVDGSGHVFVAAQGAGTLKFSAPGAVSEAFGAGISNGVTVDGAGNVFVAQATQVVEFDSSGKQVGSAFGAGSLGEPPLGNIFGIGLGKGASPLVYVADDSNNDADVFDSGETPEAPVTSETAPGDVADTTATLRGEVNPGSDTRKTGYYFEYRAGGSSCEGGAKTVAGETVGAKQAVSSEVSGLAPETQYAFCLVATNPYGVATGVSHLFTTPEAPLGVENESVTNDTADAADLNASIDAADIDTNTTYHFEYGTSESYGHSTPQSKPLNGAHTASFLVQELQPATTYHYRVVLTNPHGPIGGVVGEDESFTTEGVGGPLAMLDNRQWEMVSPPNKHGSGIEALTHEGGEIQAAEDGSAITYVANGPVTRHPAGNRAPEVSQVFSRRGSDGWETQDINTPNNAPAEYSVGNGGEYRLFSPDLSVGLLEPRSDALLSPKATEGELTLYEREDAAGSYLPLVTAANVSANAHFGPAEADYLDLKFQGASPDLKHVVFSSREALTPEVKVVSGPENLYEWSGGTLELVSVLPDGRPASEPYGEYLPERSALGTTTQDNDVRNAVSNDGTHIIWETKGGHEYEDRLYLRDMTTHETVPLDVPQQGEGSIKSGNYMFQGASSDGSRIYFSAYTPLTSGSQAVPGKYEDLYVAEVVPGGHLAIKLTDLTEDTLGGERGNFLGIVPGYSDGGAGKEANVYFVANGRLASNASPGDCNESGSPSLTCSLYMDHFDGTKWLTSLVTTLSNADQTDWGPPELHDVTSRVSPDGQFLAFMSDLELTGYDNRDATINQPDDEVYLYNANAESSDRIVCASCDPTGARPTGGGAAGTLPAWTKYTLTNTDYQSRYLSNGGRLFFESTDALVPQDINGLEDVYEYEPVVGAGSPESDSCTVGSRTYSSRSGGCVNLISSGTSAEGSSFLDASESGDDVFFLTQSRLVAGDYDKSFDVYDSRVCDGSSAIPSASGGVSGGPCPSLLAKPPACTTADSCRVAPEPQPAIFGAPPSATFSGAENVGPVASGGGVATKKKVLTRAQMLARALKACAGKPKRKRPSCVASARKRYGGKTKAASKRGGRTK